MPISFPCTACGEVFSVGLELAGKKGKCPACGAFVPVPMRSTRPDPVPPPAAKPYYEPTIQRVHLVDADLPFRSMVWLIFKWTFAAGPTAIVLWLIYVATAIFGTVLFGR